MFSFIVAILFGVVSTGTASTQTPIITSCSDTHVAVIDDMTITNAKVGERMSFSYSGHLNQDLNESPSLKMTMTKKKDNSKIMCFSNVGSCEYKLCGGTSDVEKKITEGWNNVCPVPAGKHKGSASFQIPFFAGFLIGDGNINIKMEIINGGNVVECNHFDVKIEK
ncbi:uncharacterized protein LOC120841864 [Ixodes scapularis]|uniref:uncharacterized protein LOC120841864 n=1 Tax=Ixodes scapularis TaxID=6945 RepID=UPI001A9F7E92|nr:uncharacterized protein LOC120841864 [Ixodes scapularis]